MEFYIAKILNFFTKSKKLVIFFSKLLLILFLFFSYTPLSNFILNKIEDYIQTSKYPVPQLTGVIVLGGSFNSGLQSKERNEVSLNNSAERLTKALEIYKKNPRLLILFSG
ncbi:MAG: hypothetical protein EBX84_04350, partial [Candidatus Fonsibacter lacus]|nr:hypothetical protein [Candidatus Fonsibacter lacus]